MQSPPRFYVVTAQSPTTTAAAVVGQFSANDETRMLVLAYASTININSLMASINRRGNRLVSFVIHPAGIDFIAEETVYGRIEALELIRPEACSQS